MKKFFLVLSLAAATAAGCNRQAGLEIAPGSNVTVEKKDGVAVVGRLLEVKPEHIVIAGIDGVERTVPRANIAAVRAVPLTDGRSPDAADGKPVATTGATQSDPAAPLASAVPPAPGSPDAAAETAAPVEPKADERRMAEFREVTIPTGTVLALTLRSSVGSDTSDVEDPVRATLRSPVRVGGVTALPAGTAVTGHVTSAKRSAKVKGRAQVAFRFTRIDLPGEGGQMAMRSGTVSREAPGTKKRDAATIGGGAVGGAIIGGILGGGDGAAKGAAIGGAGGTGVVLATRGKEVRLAAGTPISVRLTAPLTLRVPAR